MKKGLVASTALSASFAIGLMGLATPAHAEYPEKAVEMTVLFGGTAQTIGQLLADLMSKNMPQPVVPVSRPGGGGAVGYQYVHSTDADGYNIVWNSNSIITGYRGGRIDFDHTAFQPIAKVSVEVPAIAVRADAGWDSLADMAADIKESGNKLKVGASGKGSFTHLTTEAILASQGLSDMAVHVPYDQGRAPVEVGVVRPGQGRHVPELDRCVFSARGQEPAVRAESHVFDRPGVAGKGRDELAVLHPPETHRAVPSAAGQIGPVG